MQLPVQSIAPRLVSGEEIEQLTGDSTMRWISTMLHATIRVSMELEKVCVWYVQVT